MGGGASTLKKARRNPNADDADRLFKIIDKDENGNISVAEVHETIKKQYPDWPLSDIRATITRFDADGDRKINREEFGEALKAMQDKPEANQRVKLGEKKVNRTWTFKNAPKPEAAPKQQSSMILLPEEKTVTKEELEAAEKLCAATRPALGPSPSPPRPRPLAPLTHRSIRRRLACEDHPHIPIAPVSLALPPHPWPLSSVAATWLHGSARVA